MKKRIAAALMALVLIVVPAIAIDGVGDIVYDPINYANALVMLAELIKNYEQLKAQLELQNWMAKAVPVDMASRYRTFGTDWYGLQLPFDRFGNLSGWLQAVNQGGGAIAGYGGASIPLQSYGSLGKLAPEEQQKTASLYASAELADGTNIHSMETIGMLRGNASAVQQSIQSMEDDSLSLDPAMNTEIAVLNKINAASIASLRSSRDTNRALLSVLEQQVAESKTRRDAHVSEINTQIMRLEFGDAAKAENTATLTQSLRNFRWR
jgi:hypothetical protein